MCDCAKDEAIRKTREGYREYALKYFIYTADQRMKGFNFYIILVSALIAGFSTIASRKEINPWFSSFGFLLFFVSVIFLLIDTRCEQLVNVGKSVLEKIEAADQPMFGSKDYLLFTNYEVEREKAVCMGRWVRYSVILPTCMTVIGSLGLIGGLLLLFWNYSS